MSRVLLGTLLLTVASLKLAGLRVAMVPQAGWFASPSIQLAAAEWELVLGLWLLTGIYPFGAWVAALVTFAAFSCISAYLGSIGQTTCGCFGAIRASPWHAFGVDVACLLILILMRPSASRAHSANSANQRVVFQKGAVILGGSAGLIVVLTVTGILMFGSVDIALA